MAIAKNKIISLVLVVIAFQIIGGLMGWMTSQDLDPWYNQLIKSPLNPPDWAFGAAWTVLYFLLSLSFWAVYEAKGHPHRTPVLALFATHMILNWLWTPVFFTAHAVFPAYILILALIFTAAMLAYLIWPVSKPAALVFVPYIGWLTFAGHLTDFIGRHN